MTERKKFVCLFLCVCLCMAMGILPASAAKESDKTPVFADGMAQPVLTYTNLRESDYTNEGSDILRFCVYIETDYDTDSDGMADLVEALVQVPRPAAEGAFKAATIYDPTPYGAGTVDEDEMNSTIRMNPVPFDYSRLYEPGEKRTPVGCVSTLEAAEAADPECWNYKVPFSNLDGYAYAEEYDYYLVRDFAVVEAGGIGTYGSEGYELCGLGLERADFVVGQGQQVQGETATADCLQHLLAGRCGQDEIGVRGDVFQSLEEGVRRGIVHAVRLGDNDHAHAVSLECEGGSHGTDEPDRDFGTGTEHVNPVGILENFFDVGLLKVFDRLGGTASRHVIGAFRVGFLAFHGNHPVVGDATVDSHLAAKAMPARAHVRVAALQSLGHLDSEGLLANACRTVDKNRLRESVLAKSRHQADSLAFLRRGAIQSVLNHFCFK